MVFYIPIVRDVGAHVIHTEIDDDDDDDDARCRRAWSLSNHQKPRDDEAG